MVGTSEMQKKAGRGGLKCRIEGSLGAGLRGSWRRQNMNGTGMCKIVSRGDEVLLEGEGEKRHRSKVEPGLRKSLPPTGPYFPHL